MITTIQQFKESLLSHIGSINPDKKQIFVDTTFSPTFQALLYSELKRVLPHGYQFDLSTHGTRNFLKITDIDGKLIKFSLGENTSVYKIKNMIKQKIKINEKIEVTGFNDLVDIWNEYLKLVDIIDGIISENDGLSDSYWKAGVEEELNKITNEYQISTAKQIFDHHDEIIKNFNDLYDGLQGWTGAGHNISRYGNINKINKKLIKKLELTEAMNNSDLDENLVQTYWNSMTPENRIKTFKVTPEQSVKHWMGANSLDYLEREEILMSMGIGATNFAPVEESVNNSNNYVLEEIVTTFLAQYIDDNADYTLDSDGETVMLYIPAKDVWFDITNSEAPEMKILQAEFDEFCRANDLYDGEVTTTDGFTDLVFSADTDIIDVRNPRG